VKLTTHFHIVPKVKSKYRATPVLPLRPDGWCLVKGQILTFAHKVLSTWQAHTPVSQSVRFGLPSYMCVACNFSVLFLPLSPHTDITSVLLTLCSVCYRFSVPHLLRFPNFSPFLFSFCLSSSLSLSYLCFLRSHVFVFILIVSDSQGLFSLGLAAGPENKISSF
jgi:hypothetical protein